MTTPVDRGRFDFNVSSELLSAAPFDADILWRDSAGDNVLWLMNSNTASTQAALPFVTPDWHVKAAADFDPISGGNADILWRNDNGALVLWQMNGIAVTAVHELPNPGPTWHVVGDNDFDGLSFGISGTTGGDDILFQNDNGALALWTGINSATGAVEHMLAGTQNPGPTWHVVGTGDTDGLPGMLPTAGILWQNNNGALVLWENPTFAAGTFTFNTVANLPTVDPSWHVKGMADLNADGRSDVVFQNDNGAVAVWEMGGIAGTGVAAMNLININPGPAWHVVDRKSTRLNSSH